MPRLSIVLPAYNEEDNIVALADEIAGILPVLREEWEAECIFVDDGSSDATLDIDLQHDPRDLLKLLAELGESDVAIGIPVNRGDTFVKRASSRIANGIRNWATREDIIGTGCSLKVYCRQYLDRLL